MTTTVDSKAIDRELAEISERRWTVLDRMNRVHTAIHYAVDDVREKRSGWRMTNTEACARLTELCEDPKNFRARDAAKNLTSLDTCSSELAAINDEFDRTEAPYVREPWSRFYLVQGGHIHASRSCHTLHITTRLGWLPNLSGDTEEAAVTEHGPLLCTHCFPSAPVEWTIGPTKKTDPSQCDNKIRGDWYTRGRYAHCPECGAVASTTSIGNLRKHKRPTD
ncbi:hypothetical protein [Rhodococcus qingshengii]|uniref:hypothetical protein n=1 Tax=Rhodococcus qingshengii TaxID=334542 RepID=UPI00287FBE90|nr:hypothetical protein [Rhodococcus qingshengii]